MVNKKEIGYTQSMTKVFFIKALRQAFPITLPVLSGYLAIGIPFGLLLTQNGYPWFLAPLMSLCMYAGAGQYISIGLFAAGARLPELAATILLVNIRHIVYGLSLLTPFRTVGRWKPYLVFSLTDETYALLTGVNPPDNLHPGSFYGAIAVLNHSYWVIGSLIGALIGELLPFSLDGLDFALTALFIVLLIDQLRRSNDLVPAVIGGLCSAGALFLLGPSRMLIAALAASLCVLMLIRGKHAFDP